MTDKPAYPVPDGEHWDMKSRDDDFNGLTRRELFAAMAMQGMLASDNWDWKPDGPAARTAIRFADELIAELDKPR